MKISIAPVEFFIKCRIVFVALFLGVTINTFVIAYNMSPAVLLSPKRYFGAIVATTRAVVVSVILLLLFN